MSMGAQAKAVNLGIQTGKTAEQEGWGEGQPSVRIMGRKIAVMRRWGYNWQETSEKLEDQDPIKQEEKEGGQELPPTTEAISIGSQTKNDADSQETMKGDPSTSPPSISPNPQIQQRSPE
ncbi:MAG: hypothetical protein Q9168_005067, partial [Polycauliona sp. 1 TL-2023]